MTLINCQRMQGGSLDEPVACPGKTRAALGSRSKKYYVCVARVSSTYDGMSAADQELTLGSCLVLQLQMVNTICESLQYGSKELATISIDGNTGACVCLETRKPCQVDRTSRTEFDIIPRVEACGAVSC
jgi:hypothetical protein